MTRQRFNHFATVEADCRERSTHDITVPDISALLTPEEQTFAALGYTALRALGRRDSLQPEAEVFL